MPITTRSQKTTPHTNRWKKKEKEGVPQQQLKRKIANQTNQNPTSPKHILGQLTVNVFLFPRIVNGAEGTLYE
jgi:hypothetical protein